MQVTVELMPNQRDRPTILIVEDEVLIRMDISDALRRAGYHVLEAAKAEDAIAILYSGVPVAVVFTDVRLAGPMDGLQLAVYIRDNHPATGCIMTSGHISASDVPSSVVAPLIPKPYTHERVLAEIARHLLLLKLVDSRNSAT
ncbi:response regulator [Nordella sp. HKS 07]|uniref:response regulator n=1 Tax=Nordella sp. HKS 07 TaxID=2712222 RepID=UPI0013E1EF42|nr:response regulator [Nordella sp. HKS 07]QIG46796.1 response regulator [Nordella sp. HKS 07]